MPTNYTKVFKVLTSRHGHTYYHKSSDTATYLLQLSTQYSYFSARTSMKDLPWRVWSAYFESLALETTDEFSQMGLNSTVQDNKGGQNNMQYIVVKILYVVVEGRTNRPPNIKTFEDVIRSLRAIRSIPDYELLAEELFWTLPLDNITDVPSLDLIVRPQLQLQEHPTSTILLQAEA